MMMKEWLDQEEPEIYDGDVVDHLPENALSHVYRLGHSGSVYQHAA